jgi:hypothetical protein
MQVKMEDCESLKIAIYSRKQEKYQKDVKKKL